jgi:hypothetical protein
MAYDMNNTGRSFKGAPTTNLYPGLGLAAVQGVSYTYISTDNDGWMKYGLNGTWASGGYPYSGMVSAYTFTGGVYYTTSCWIKTNVPSKFANLFTGMNYVNQPMNSAGTSFSVTSANGDIFVGRQNFCYTSTTSQNGYFVSNPTADGVTFNSATDFVWIKQGQIEVQPWPTPYTTGTRSTTQSVLDLTGQNILTSTSLTYASDNTFSFNGSSNYLTVGASSNWAFGQNGTIEQLVYLSGSSGNNRLWCVTNDTSSLDAYLNGTGYTLYFHGNTVGTTAAIPTNQWCHIVVTYTAGVFAVYFNAVSQSLSGTTTGYNITNGGTLYVGQYSGGGSYYLNGKIPTMRVYNRGLSATEVSQNFQATRGRYGL